MVTMKAATQRQFGAQLGKLRKSAGLTQADVASKVGLSVVTLSRIETGVQWTDFKTLSKFAALYKVPMSELFAMQPVKKLDAKAKTLDEIQGLLAGRTLEDVELARDLLARLFRRKRSRRGS